MVFVIAHLYIKLVRADEIFDCWKCSSFILRRKYRISAYDLLRPRLMNEKKTYTKFNCYLYYYKRKNEQAVAVIQYEISQVITSIISSSWLTKISNEINNTVFGEDNLMPLGS